MKTCKHYFVLILVFWVSLSISAQIKIKGTIKDVDKIPYPMIPVTLRSLPDSTIIAYGFSDTDGNFQVEYNGDRKTLEISIGGMQIIPQAKNIKKENQTIDFIVKEKYQVLREVVVKGEKMWGKRDTLNYLVSAFSHADDVVIGDVLKRMPGINVSESGEISYQGKRINKFYVENLDLLGGRYGIAANNVSAKDVATVQVFENHQPIKALTDIQMSDNAAINIKLKDGAKGKLIIMPRLGIGGFPSLWQNELSAVYFSNKVQDISTYKGNNTGVDLSDEYKQFITNNFFGESNMLNIQMPSSPTISKRRYLLNNENAFSFNHLLRTGKNGQLNLNVVYTNNHEKKNSEAYTAYYLPGDSIYIINEDLHGALNTNKIDAEVRYNLNDKHNFLDNISYIQGLWANNYGDINNQIHQRMNNLGLTFTNNLHWVRTRDEGKGIEVRSYFGYRYSPQTLTIRPGLYEDLFNEGESYAALRQKNDIDHLYFNNAVKLLSAWKIGNIVIDPTFILNIENKTLKSDMYTLKDDNAIVLLDSDSLKNDLHWTKLSGSINLAFRYYIGKMKLNLSLPLSYNLIHIHNTLSTDKNTDHHIFFNPYIELKYELTKRINLIGSYSYNQAANDISTLYTGYILESYRNLNRYDNQRSKTYMNAGNVHFEYKDIFHMFFLNGEIYYRYVKSDVLYAQHFQQILTLTSAERKENHSKNISLHSNVSKGFNLMNLVSALSVNYGIYTSEGLRQNELIQYKNKSLSITGTLSIRPTSWFTLDYETVWNKLWNKIEKEEAFAPIRTFKNTIKGGVMLSNRISLNTSFEHYYNSGVQTHRYLSFTDASLQYRLKGINLSLECLNIFDQDKYMSAYYTDINSYKYTYKIRGRSLLLKAGIKL